MRLFQVTGWAGLFFGFLAAATAQAGFQQDSLRYLELRLKSQSLMKPEVVAEYSKDLADGRFHFIQKTDRCALLLTPMEFRQGPRIRGEKFDEKAHIEVMAQFFRFKRSAVELRLVYNHLTPEERDRAKLLHFMTRYYVACAITGAKIDHKLLESELGFFVYKQVFEAFKDAGVGEQEEMESRVEGELLVEDLKEHRLSSAAFLQEALKNELILGGLPMMSLLQLDRRIEWAVSNNDQETQRQLSSLIQTLFKGFSEPYDDGLRKDMESAWLKAMGTILLKKSEMRRDL